MRWARAMKCAAAAGGQISFAVSAKTLDGYSLADLLAPRARLARSLGLARALEAE